MGVSADALALAAVMAQPVRAAYDSCWSCICPMLILKTLKIAGLFCSSVGIGIRPKLT
jgi:hypothetical protein